MLNKTMWNIFKGTGNVYAYLYVKEYDENYNIESKDNKIAKRAPLEVKEITII